MKWVSELEREVGQLGNMVRPFNGLRRGPERRFNRRPPRLGYIISLQSGNPRFMLLVAVAGSNTSESNRPPPHSRSSSCRSRSLRVSTGLPVPRQRARRPDS